MNRYDNKNKHKSQEKENMSGLKLMLIIALGILSAGLIWFLISLILTGALIGGIGKGISNSKPFKPPTVNFDNSNRLYSDKQKIPTIQFPRIPQIQQIPVQPEIIQSPAITNNAWNVIRTNDEECRFRRENGIMVKECKKI